MALYMAQFAYTAEALATMAKNPQDRSVPSRELIEKSGGRLISFYFCFGEYDGVAIYEAPDERPLQSQAPSGSAEGAALCWGVGCPHFSSSFLGGVGKRTLQ